jgi:Sulfatase-modifying factor enzyme 1
VSSRGLIWGHWAILTILAIMPGMARSGETVVLNRWADEGALIQGKGMGEDVVRLVAEASWDKLASRDPARYMIRVAFPDGRIDTRPFPVDYPPGRPRFTVYVLADPLRNQAPAAVSAAVTVLDASTGTPLSNTLVATIEHFPRPKGDSSGNDPGPFGWGKPLDGPIRILTNAGPDGLKFAKIAGSPGLFLSTTEATVGQVGQRVKGYDPKAGRSDEFALEDPNQPAINLTPAKAKEYLEALGKADPSGVTYRLPTSAEWTLAAKGGKSSNFWWGDEPTYPAGANLLGPEPALPGDASAPSLPKEASPTFELNPFGLAHTFGNVAEWATDPDGGFNRMGGHFRTEPASPLPFVKVEKDEEIGPDPFVGVRPAVELAPASAVELIRKRLAGDSRLNGAIVAYDPDGALVTLSGPVPDPSTRRSADSLLKELWFVAAVDNRLETAPLIANQMAILGPAIAPARRVAFLDRTFVEVPVSIRWLDPLPVSGTAWWVNVYLPGGGHQSTKLEQAEAGKSSKVVVRIDREKLAAQGLPDTTPIQVALSIGTPAPALADARVVTNAVEVRPTFPAKTR